MSVEFILATDPETRHTGSVRKYGETTTLNDTQDDYGLLVTVDIDEEMIANLRPGARVIGKIQCGQRSLGYVWFHDVFEFAQSQWFRLF